MINYLLRVYKLKSIPQTVDSFFSMLPDTLGLPSNTKLHCSFLSSSGITTIVSSVSYQELLKMSLYRPVIIDVEEVKIKPNKVSENSAITCKVCSTQLTTVCSICLFCSELVMCQKCEVIHLHPVLRTSADWKSINLKKSLLLSSLENTEKPANLQIKIVTCDTDIYCLVGKTAVLTLVLENNGQFEVNTSNLDVSAMGQNTFMECEVLTKAIIKPNMRIKVEIAVKIVEEGKMYVNIGAKKTSFVRTFKVTVYSHEDSEVLQKARKKIEKLTLKQENALAKLIEVIGDTKWEANFEVLRYFDWNVAEAAYDILK